MPRTEVGQFDVNFTGIQAQKLFLDPIFLDKSVMSMFQVMPNIKNGKQKMLFAGAIDDYLRLRKGCGFNPIGNMKINERCITVDDVKGETEQCWDEFLQTILLEALNNGIRKADITDTILLQMVLNRLRLGAERQINKLAFFGDKSTIDETQNLVDGLFTVYLPDLVAQQLTPRVDSQSGTALASGEAIELFRAVYKSATNELDAFDAPQKVFMTTRQVWDQLWEDLVDGTSNSNAFVMMNENDKQRMFFKGVEIVKMSRWEGLAAQYLGGLLPAVTENYNLVLYTHRRNLVLGTNMASDINRFESWFERKEETNCTRTAFMLGFNYVHPSLMAVAY